ncbi:hypothetical protein Skr01_15500 [Sphaerisporangium krabiense]|uniref:Protein kinase domain-containing protein n=1 Tax=Sphaerisporangium krabiense TaxID=763782 RepID=A0A7W8YZE8_9ACTN|nr:protein kinase family protein [Sphaerisporangium krabiense]MBB5624581.1 hypothetical protein [Sphaerisporangium krabiense]GII61465.1 hypothetical protein Skr01_15500 [Sphaerisporangium krabiense]
MIPAPSPGSAPPTVPDPPPPAATVADEGHGTPGRATVPPEALRARLGAIEPLTELSGEARVYLAREGGEPVVLKVYDGPSAERAEVYAALARVTSPYVVKPREWDADADPPWELGEYLPYGTLRDLLVEHPGGLPAGALREVAGQCADALRDLHGDYIRHRDIKPDNILVRNRDPLRIGLADFGVARRTEDDLGRVARASGTTRYMSPQAIMGLVSADDDWWSLGVTLAELALGRHPLPVGDKAYTAHVAVNPLDVSAVEDPALRLLCQGLLLRNPDDRWKYAQVRRWLDGDPPALARAPEPTAAHGSPPFLGASYSSPAELAAALARGWTAATGWAAEHREELDAWLAHFPEVDRPVPAHPSPDIALLYLIRALSPQGPPWYRGHPLLPEHIPAIARRAVAHTAHWPAVVSDLWRYGLLTVLDGAEGGHGLAAYDARWRRDEERRRALVAAPEYAGTPVRDLDPALARAELLLLAAERGRAAEARKEVARTRALLAEMRVPVPWFTRLAARDDPVATLVAALLCDAAETYAHERHEVWRAWLDDRRRTALREWLDRTQRSTALGWAAMAVAVPAFLWVIALTLSDLVDIASARAIAVSWLWAALCVLVMAVTEIPFAAWLGRAYHPRHSLAATMILAARRALRPLRGRRWASLLVLTGLVAALSLALSLAPVLLPAGAIVAHLAWLVVRARRRRAGAGPVTAPADPPALLRSAS